MARENKELEIGTEKYTLTHWDPDHAMSMLVRFIKLAGEPLAKMIVGAVDVAKESEEGMDKELTSADQAQFMSDALGSLALRLNEGDVKTFFRDAQKGVISKDGKLSDSGVYMVHFTGRPGQLMKLTMENMRHQFQDFLELLPGLSGKS